MQAIFVGLINLVFTILAILLIDKLGRRPLLIFGMTGIAAMTFLLARGFQSATYVFNAKQVEAIEVPVYIELLANKNGITYPNDVAFKRALAEILGEEAAMEYETDVLTAAIDINPTLILFDTVGFAASFAISIGPVTWAMLSELFPLRVRGLAISFAGFINSGLSFPVQVIVPWKLATLGSSMTFLIYGLFAAAGLIF